MSGYRAPSEAEIVAAREIRDRYEAGTDMARVALADAKAFAQAHPDIRPTVLARLLGVDRTRTLTRWLREQPPAGG